MSPLAADKSYPGGSQGVLLLNVASSGLDPAIKNFLTLNKNLPGPGILTLRPQTSDFTFTYLEAAKSPQGVDVITAATAWSDWDNGNQTMHQSWAKKVCDLFQQP